MADTEDIDLYFEDVKRANELKAKEETSAQDRQSLSWLWALVILIVGCVIYYIVHVVDHVLPAAVSSEMAHRTDVFNAYRARDNLRELVKFGPRVVGSATNEVIVSQFIYNKLKNIENGTHPNQKVLVEIQTESGLYETTESKKTYINVYENVKNVIAMLQGSNGKHSILINCHYDCVPEAGGATDNGISCAVMMELLQVLAARETRLEHNIIFLFNGAEEPGLLGAHSFLAHKWKENCTTFINLEGAGAGGRALLFQTGPKTPWLFNYYTKSAPYPHALVLAEEMFQSGFIPSITDFEILRDFGEMPGFDFAFCRYAYVYHTKFDVEQLIPIGSYQFIGENALALVKALGNAGELYDMDSNAEGDMVYYDFLGWFMVSYSYEASIALNVILLIASLLSIIIFIGHILKWSWLTTFINSIRKIWRIITCYKLRYRSTFDDDIFKIDDESIRREMKLGSTICEFLIALAARILAMGVCIATGVVVALIIDSAATLKMPWFSNVWLLFPLYWCPCLLMYSLVVLLVEMWRLKSNKMSLVMRTRLNIVVAQVPFLILFLVATCMGIRSSAMLYLQCLFSTVSNFVIFLTPLYNTVHAWIWVYLFLQLPAVLMNMYLVLLAHVIFIPIMGESGVINADMSMALIAAASCILIATPIIPLATMVRKIGIVYMLSAIFSIVMIVVALTTDVGHPYRTFPERPAPQRYRIMHTSREIQDEFNNTVLSENGYFVMNMDNNSPYTIPPEMRVNMTKLEDDCDTYFYCGLPFLSTGAYSMTSDSNWIPASPAEYPIKTNLNIISRDCDIANATCSFNFRISAPDRLTITFSPRGKARLRQWNLPINSTRQIEYKDRPLYFLHLVRARIDGDFYLNLEFDVSNDQLQGDPIFDIGLGSHLIHHEQYRTKEFQNLLNSLPDWTHSTGWISAYKGYVF